MAILTTPTLFGSLYPLTTYKHEANLHIRNSFPLILTFLLQYSFPVVSVLTLGRLGTLPLGAVSLATMTANITGYAVYQGLATALDTLCSQAYGAGHNDLVGLHLQRMVLLLWIVTVPIGAVWLSSESILGQIVPEKDTARLAGVYLKVLLSGAPGWAAFEAGKKFVQAQGVFWANFYILLVLAPLNAILHWLFVWRLGWGFVGAPVAVALVNNLMPVCLVTYVRFVKGKECWGGFSKAAFSDWGPMFRLALPGFLMIEAEWLAFEILTLSASWLGSTYLAAQSVVMTVATLGSQIPISVSIAASTRIANLIGANTANSARLSAEVAMIGSLVLSMFNTIIIASLRKIIPQIFTADEEVASYVANVLPLIAAFQLFEGPATMCNGLLRGIGRQKIGGYVALGCFYLVRTVLQ